MNHDPKKLEAILIDAAPPDLEIVCRSMFGGILAYVGGRPFASLSNMGLALKVSGSLGSEFRAVPGAQPLRYNPEDPPSKSYVLVPERLLSDRVGLCTWIVRVAEGLESSASDKR